MLTSARKRDENMVLLSISFTLAWLATKYASKYGQINNFIQDFPLFDAVGILRDCLIFAGPTVARPKESRNVLLVF